MGSCHCCGKAKKYYADIRHKLDRKNKKNKKPPKPEEIKIEDGVQNQNGKQKKFKFSLNFSLFTI